MMVTVCDAFIEPVLTVKVVLAVLAETVAEAGKVRILLIAPESARTAPPASEGFDKVTVHVVLELETRDAALHWIEETSTNPTSGRVQFRDEPFRPAVMVAF